MERQLEMMGLQAVLLVARLAAISIGALAYNILTTIVLLSIASALCYGAFTLYVTRMAGNSVFIVWQPCRFAFAASCIIVAPILAIKIISGLPSIYSVAAILLTSLTCALYYWLLLRKMA
jgi:hypothetical protein